MKKNESIIDFKPNLSFLKCIAIISVFIAHLNNDSTQAIFSILEKLSIIGVPLFLFLLGYQYDLKSKKKSVVYKKEFYISWLFWSSIIFGVTSFFGSQTSSISVLRFITYILGYYSIYYFNTILVFITIVSNKISHFRVLLILSIVLNLILLGLNIIQTDVHLLGYLNPFFWFTFFLLGVVSKPVILKHTSFITNPISLIVLMIITILLAITPESKGFSYFSISSFILCLFSVLFLTILSFKIELNRNIFEKNTYFMYLTHLPLAGILSRIFLMNYGFSMIIRLCILILFYVVSLRIYEAIINKNESSILFNKYSSYLGLRL